MLGVVRRRGLFASRHGHGHAAQDRGARPRETDSRKTGWVGRTRTQRHPRDHQVGGKRQQRADGEARRPET